MKNSKNKKVAVLFRAVITKINNRIHADAVLIKKGSGQKERMIELRNPAKTQFRNHLKNLLTTV